MRQIQTYIGREIPGKKKSMEMAALFHFRLRKRKRLRGFALDAAGSRRAA